MGKLIASSANLNLNSNQEFPTVRIYTYFCIIVKN